MGDKKTKTHIDDLYDSQGFLRRAQRLDPDFLRPLYQYTSAEIRNHQRESFHPESVIGYDCEYLHKGNKLTVDTNLKEL